MPDFGAIGGGIGSIAGGIGDLYEASAYGKAADLAKQNAAYAKLSLGIQLNQANRNAYQVTGGIKAAVGSSGLAQSGTANDVLRSSAQQLGLQRGLTAVQGQININEWLEKAAADEGQSKAAEAAGAGGIAGGIFGIIGGFMPGG